MSSKPTKKKARRPPGGTSSVAAGQRIKAALDTVAANVMVADKNLNIVYLNRTVEAMLRNAEADIRKDLPRFDVNRLIGTNIDSFHRNPSHQRGLLAGLAKTFESSLKLGGRTLRIIANPVIGARGERLGTVVEWSDQTEQLRREQLERDRAEADQRIAADNMRVKVALDNVSTNVMMADTENRIIYVNKSMTQMFQNAASALRRDLPTFDPDKLIGASMDLFHRSPAHQQRLLAAMRGASSSDMKLGGRSFHIVANPVLDAQGQRIGTVVEWVDRTQEVAVEEEIGSAVTAAMSGDLSKKIGNDGKTGFFAKLADGVNGLMQNMATLVDEVNAVVEQGKLGDLSKRIDRTGKDGAFGKLADGVNGIMDNMSAVIAEVNTVVASGKQGDLMPRIDVSDKLGAFGTLSSGINELMETMMGVVRQIKLAAQEVSTGSTEISKGNTNLSQRTEEQASSLEETASSMEQMTSTVKNNAESAGQANQLALAARQQAEKGGSVVTSAVRAMQEINSSSKKIADIIGVIDEIAFQTNLLALNAAVEAARAGDQGRGFAVVASEVRNLAGRSATAAKEIKSLIQDSVTKVNEGSSLVDQSGAMLAEIVTSVKKVSDIVAEITAASQEQSTGIEQVNKAIMQMDEVTQQNAALVEEAAAAAESLQEQANKMSESMAQFNVGDTPLPAPASRQARAPLADRRGPQRSWSTPDPAKAQQKLPKSATPARKAAGDDSEWSEF